MRLFVARTFSVIFVSSLVLNPAVATSFTNTPVVFREASFEPRFCTQAIPARLRSIFSGRGGRSSAVAQVRFCREFSGQNGVWVLQSPIDLVEPAQIPDFALLFAKRKPPQRPVQNTPSAPDASGGRGKGPNRRTMLWGAIGAVGLGGAYWISNLLQRESPSPAPIPVVRQPIHRAMPPPIPRERLRDKAFVKEYLKNAVLKEFGRFDAEIARMDLLPGYTREDFTNAVTEFINFLDKADMQFPSARHPGATFSVDHDKNVFTYNPDKINQLLPFLDVFLFHEMSHFTRPQKLRNERELVLMRGLFNFISQNLTPEVVKEVRGRSSIDISVIIEKRLWHIERLKENRQMADAFAEFLQNRWLDENEAIYFQTALLAAQTDGTPGSVSTLVMSRPVTDIQNIDVEFRTLGAAFQAGVLSAEFLTSGFADIVGDQITANYFAALRTAEAGDEFVVPMSFRRMEADVPYGRQVMAWALGRILNRPRTRAGSIPRSSPPMLRRLGWLPSAA